MTRILALLILLAATAPAKVVKVCASGCAFTQPQTAIDDATTVSGDVIELRSGEAFNGFVIREKSLTVRNSRYLELPPIGTRVSPALGTALFAEVKSIGGERGLMVGHFKDLYVSCDISSDTITVSVNTPIIEGSVVNLLEAPTYGRLLPGGLAWNVKYRATNITSMGGSNYRLQLKRPDGTIADITSNATLPDGYLEIMRENPIRVVTYGLRFTGPASYAMVQAGDDGTVDRNAGPSLYARHIWIDGDPNIWGSAPNGRGGPVYGVALFNGHDHVVRDSYLSGMHAMSTPEAWAVGVVNSDGVLIENNFGSASGIFLITGGSIEMSRRPPRHVTVRGNYFRMEAWMKYSDGNGAPTHTCFYANGFGEFYRRLDGSHGSATDCSGGACYTCKPDNTWAIDVDATLRTSSVADKVGIELKSCDDCLVEGNLIQFRMQTMQAGMGWAGGPSTICEASPNNAGQPLNEYVSNTVYRYNHADRVWTGWFVRASTYFGCEFALGYAQRSVLIHDNLITGLGADYPKSCALSLSNGVTACNNTTYSSVGTQQWGIAPSTASQGNRHYRNTTRGPARFCGLFNKVTGYGTWLDMDFSDNLLECTWDTVDAASTYVVSSDTGSDCNNSTGWGSMGPSTVRNNIFVSGATPILNFNTGTNCASYASNNIYSATAPGYVGADNTLDPRDSALTSASPYSKANGSPTRLSTTGDTLGADMMAIAQRTLPALHGQPAMHDQLGVVALRSGTTVTVSLGTKGTSCTVTLYSDWSRTAQTGTSTQTGAPTTPATFTFTNQSGTRYYHATCASIPRPWTGGLWAVGEI